MATYPEIELVGSGRERGDAYGRAAGDLIRANLRTYEARFDRGGLRWASVRRQAQRFLPWIEAFDSDLAEEIRALARAAGIDVVDAVALNARSSLLYNLSDDCTSIAFLSDRGDRCTVLGQNWDNMAALRPVLLKVFAPDAPALMTLTEAGTLAKIGFNSVGLGVCVNGLLHAGASAQGSVPLFVFLRRLLSRSSLADALKLVRECRRDAPHNFLLGSRDEGAVDVETLYADDDVLPSDGPTTVHTNHLISERLRAQSTIPAHCNSLLRLRRAEDMVAATRAQDRTAETMLRILGDHENAPDTICRHRAADENGLHVVTKHAVVMDLVRSEMFVTDGAPCSAPTDTYSLAAFDGTLGMNAATAHSDGTEAGHARS